MAEQSLVENLLDGNFYSSQNFAVLSQNSLQSSLDIGSGNGQTPPFMNRNIEIK